MKNITSILTIAIIFSSCGGKNQNVEDVIATGDLKVIRATKTEISEKHKALEQQIKLLDSSIGVLDSDENFPLVSTLEVKAHTFNHSLVLQGYIKTKHNVLIHPEMAGALIRVYVKE